jgi:hypothetical protein
MVLLGRGRRADRRRGSDALRASAELARRLGMARLADEAS